MSDNQSGLHLVESFGWTVGRFVALESAGLSHAVTTRRGPDVARIRTDSAWAARQVADKLGLTQAAWLDQIHGNVVIPVQSGGLAGRGDGLVTAVPSLGLVGRSADCPLILLADTQSGVVGMAHASWRGTVQRIAVALVDAATKLGAQPRRMIACICPSAGPCCYEVGPDVRQAALTGIGAEAETFFRPRGDKWLLDLWCANRGQLQESGLADSNIHVAGVCTLCRNDLFPSYRREGALAGRFLAAIAAGTSQPPPEIG